MNAWTREDLPRIGTPDPAHDSVVDGVLDTVVHWLNKHHPKPCANCVVVGGQSPAWVFRALDDDHQQALAKVDRERDDLRRQVEDLHQRRRKHADERAAWTRNRRELISERDAAVARAEQAENARDTVATRAGQLEKRLAKVMSDYQDLEDEARPVVTRADIEKCVYGSRRAGRECDEQGFAPIHVQEAVDQLCALFGIEAEQAVDPVEEKARELYLAATPDAQWETVADEYRRIARHVLGQEVTR